MKHLKLILLICIIMNEFTNGQKMSAQTWQLQTIERVLGFPTDETGIEKGVSACFAGTAGNSLLMAGGCNFPGTPAAEGGKKHYYQGIYAAEITCGNQLDWKLVGRLPQPCAYGVSIQLEDGILCVGGNNTDQSFVDAYRIHLENGRAVVTPYPALPVALDNFTGCRCGNMVTVSDGHRLYTLDLARPEHGWSESPAGCDEKLGQPVSGSINGTFCLWGGCTTKTAERPTTLNIPGQSFGAQRATLPPPVDNNGTEIYLGGAAALNLSDDAIVIVGGVNKDVFLDAVNNPKPGYMTHAVEWYRFNRYICVFQDNRWYIAGKNHVAARAGAALVKQGNSVYIIGGELKPGIRTPEIYRLNFNH